MVVGDDLWGQEAHVVMGIPALRAGGPATVPGPHRGRGRGRDVGMETSPGHTPTAAGSWVSLDN